MSARAQTEAVGTLTLAVAVVLLTSTVGFAVVESMASADAAERALGDYRFDADATGVAVTHAGGDALPLSDLALVVRGDDGRTTASFTSGTLADGGPGDGGSGDGTPEDGTPEDSPSGDGADEFAPGATWRYDGAPFPLDGVTELDVLVVHRPSETVVDWTTVRVGVPATPTATSTPTPTPTATPTPTPTPAPPTVTTFEARNPDGRQVRVELRTDRRLETVRVVVRRGADGTVATTLTGADFAGSGDGPYAYVATTTVERTGNYRVVLETARAADGPDAATGQERQVHVDDESGGWWDDWWFDGGWFDGGWFDGWWGDLWGGGDGGGSGGGDGGSGGNGGDGDGGDGEGNDGGGDGDGWNWWPW